LAGIVTAHTGELAQELALFAQQTMPLYAAEEGARLPPGMWHYFEAVAQAAADGDMAPLRGYLERFVPLRLQEGVPGEDYIQLVNQGETLIQALIAQEATDAERSSDAQRLTRSIGHNARLIISEVNLQLLINPGCYDEVLPASLPPRIPTTPAA
jgi:hypothetical protein